MRVLVRFTDAHVENDGLEIWSGRAALVTRGAQYAICPMPPEYANAEEFWSHIAQAVDMLIHEPATLP